MKKLVACVCCAMMCAMGLAAQSAADKANQVAQKADRQAFLKGLKTYVYINHILSPAELGYYDDKFQNEIHTRCSAVLLDGKGNMAIKSDCYKAIVAAAQYECVNMFVDLENFGFYNNGDPFSFETFRATVRSADPDACYDKNEYFEIQKSQNNKIQFLKYHIDFPEGSELKAGLEKAFANQKPVTADEAAQILGGMRHSSSQEIARQRS